VNENNGNRISVSWRTKDNIIFIYYSALFINKNVPKVGSEVFTKSFPSPKINLFG